MKILDSDHCVAILRGKLDLTSRVSPEEELATTVISFGELVHGAVKSQNTETNLARLDILLAALLVLPFDELPARLYGQLKAQLELAGEPVSDLDLQIASIAIDRQAVLVSHNQKHFSKLSERTGLLLEDWLA